MGLQGRGRVGGRNCSVRGVESLVAVGHLVAVGALRKFIEVAKQ